MSLTTPSLNEDFASDGLPIFLGDPYAKPEPKLPEYPWSHILVAIDLIHEKYQRESWPPEDPFLTSIIRSASILEQIEFDKTFQEWVFQSHGWGDSPDQAWSALHNILEQATQIDTFPNLDALRYTTPAPTRHRNPKPTSQWRQTAPYKQPVRKSDRQDELRQEITPRPIVEPSPISTPKPQGAKIIPIRKLQQPLSAPTKLADKWKLDSRWAKLTPCAVALLYALLRRTYNVETFKKITEAFTKGRTWFPWCLKGIESLSKRLEYTKKSSPKVKHYGHCQISNAFKQLQELGFISTFYRGYEGQGAGKCHAFLNPKMSAAFHRESRTHKKGSNPRT